MRLLLTIVLALAASAAAGFMALFVCALAGFAGAALEHGAIAAMATVLPGVPVYVVAATRRAPAQALRAAFRLLLALSLAPPAVMLAAEMLRVRPGWMRGWDTASVTVMAVACVAVVTVQWAVFRWLAPPARAPLPMRFGRQP